jgi:hypothetical protein
MGHKSQFPILTIILRLDRLPLAGYLALVQVKSRLVNEP